jgi:Fe-S-cluster containining protein
MSDAERLSPDEAADIAESFAEELERGTAARAQVAARQGLPIVCDRGCAGCCEELVIVYLPEALAVARWLSRPENAEARSHFAAAYHDWRLRVGDAPQALAALHQAGDRDGYQAAHVEQWRKRVVCAFNKGGDCTIYPVRPLSCRNAHAVETPDRCFGDHPSGLPASRLAFPPIDDFMRRADELLAEAHRAAGGVPRRAEALCELVYRLL